MLATVKLFLVSWLVAIMMLTLATLRLPSAFTAVFALVDLALLLLLLAFAEASPLGVPSSGLLKTGGYVVLVFAALGVYLFFGAASGRHRREGGSPRQAADEIGQIRPLSRTGRGDRPGQLRATMARLGSRAG